MSSPFEGLPQCRDEAGRLWVFVFGRWTPIAEPDEGSAAVPARLHSGPSPLAGGAGPDPVGRSDEQPRGQVR